MSCMWIQDEILIGFAMNGLKNTESLIYMRAEQQHGSRVLKCSNWELQEEKFHIAVL